MSPHSFIVPAYGVSPHLPACLASLREQTVASAIVVTTSTPSVALERMVAAAGVDLVVNPIAAGAASDWTFALQQASTRWVTLAHQDDRYRPAYAERCLAAVEDAPDSLLVFTDYDEETAGGERGHTLNLLVKRLLSRPYFLGGRSIRSTWARRGAALVRQPDPVSDRDVQPRAAGRRSASTRPSR